MRLLDLFCGRWGWSRAFAARGWECVGIDLVKACDTPPGLCNFIQHDVLGLTVKDGWFWLYGQPYVCTTHFDFICASSSCENFSLFQIRNFHPDPPYPEHGIKLFNHTRLLCEKSGIPYVMENVARAQDFVGKAVNHAGSFYLWGNGVPPLLPEKLTKGMKMDRAWCQELGGHGSAKRDAQTAGFATIPPELANCVADYAERLCGVPAKVGYVRHCKVCGLRKAPRGRSVADAMANSLCDHDCPGYMQEPLPGDLWPGETAEEFGYPCTP